VQGTSYEEIAHRAGVSQATVYRHFPSLESLLPACSRSIVVLQPLTEATIDRLFDGLVDPWTRLQRLIRGTCECYGRDEAWLHAARREGDVVSALADIVRVQQEGLGILVRAALNGSGAGPRAARVIAALIDFPVWKSFRDVGFSVAAASEQVLELAKDRLAGEKTRKREEERYVRTDKGLHAEVRRRRGNLVRGRADDPEGGRRSHRRAFRPARPAGSA
jgi:AcrR family transcriptional regulator